MRPEHWQQLDQLFHSALQREPSERAALLDKECAGDDGLRHEVEVLLAAQEEAGNFIERPAIEVEANSVAAEQDKLTAGQTIGHYRIVSLLGAGGMGEVYLAEDTMLGRNVALKLLPAGFTRDIDRVRRFQQEAHAASALNHPNIVTVYEIAHLDDRHLIATEFIDGETLRERIRESRSQTSKDGSEKAGTALPIPEVLNIGIQIADAIAAAHEAGIVHRDIKPENIMVRRRDGYIKVLDFGLAKLTEAPSVAGGHSVDAEAATRPQVKTSAGLVMGTVTYMSPEQTRGEKVDARTDIWSLGVVLYELVAGCAPFERPTPSEVIAGILEREPLPLTDYVGEIPSELQRIISKALTKNRESRYQSAKNLLIDLRHLQHDLEIGSKFNVSTIPETGESQATESSPKPLTRAISADEIPRPVRRQRRNLVWAGMVTLVAVVLIATVIYRLYLPVRATTFDSVAVLPLVNAGNNPDTDYLSDGVTESLINSLSQLQQLRVTPRTTVFRYKGKEIDPEQVGRELGVGAILTGRLIQNGDKLDIQVELVDTSKGGQVWGQQYNRNFSTLAVVKQEIARDVGERLRPALVGEDEKRLNRGDTVNTEAYNFYLRGRQFWNKRTAERLKKAIGEFQQAIDKDPNYALAYVGLADCYVLLQEYAGTPSSETLPKARAAVQRALQIDDSLAEAHASLGMIELNSWNFTEAEGEFRRAIELNPNYPTVHNWYGFYLRLARGRFDEAAAEITLAQQLDPLSPTFGAHLAQAYIDKGELDMAMEEAKKVLELNPNFVEAYRVLGILYRRQGRYDEAVAELEKAVELSGRQGWYLGSLGVCHAVAGNRDRAREILKELEEKYNRREALGQHIADVYAALGDKEQAFAWLEKDFKAHSGFLLLIAHDPGEAPLRAALSSDPRWNDLLRRIGLPAN